MSYPVYRDLVDAGAPQLPEGWAYDIKRAHYGEPAPSYRVAVLAPRRGWRRVFGSRTVALGFVTPSHPVWKPRHPAADTAAARFAAHINIIVRDDRFVAAFRGAGSDAMTGRHISP